jgi:DNA-binding response OmpR family regulator
MTRVSYQRPSPSTSSGEFQSGETLRSRDQATLRRCLSVETARAQTILICEDDEDLRQLIRVVLGGRYRFVEAHDGPQALELALRLRPDLIILDLMLPGTSGLDVLTQLREQLPDAETRVIVMSAWGHADQAALSAGADRFVPKPFEPDELTAIVSEVLEGR